MGRLAWSFVGQGATRAPHQSAPGRGNGVDRYDMPDESAIALARSQMMRILLPFVGRYDLPLEKRLDLAWALFEADEALPAKDVLPLVYPGRDGVRDLAACGFVKPSDLATFFGPSAFVGTDSSREKKRRDEKRRRASSEAV